MQVNSQGVLALETASIVIHLPNKTTCFTPEGGYLGRVAFYEVAFTIKEVSTQHNQLNLPWQV